MCHNVEIFFLKINFRGTGAESIWGPEFGCYIIAQHL